MHNNSTFRLRREWARCVMALPARPAPTEAMTMMSRRHFITTGAAACCSLIASRSLSAEPYPQHPIKIIVAGLPGVPFDILARAVATKLSASLKQPVIVEDRPGAAG